MLHNRSAARRSLASLLLLTALATPHAHAAEGSKYETDWAAFTAEIDRSYPFLDLKGIRGDWEKFKEQAAPRAKACGTDDAFLGLVRGAIYCLRDAHMGFA
ncbi:MAG: hypothetical protein NTW87_33555, partial [Planctomycetota bacterium]|nr:hypothetical protein [Planctomycetota bacterium]